MALRAPTPPTPPTPPSMNGSTAPEVKVESSGPPIPAGELHTPAEQFGIHIHIGGSGADNNGNADEALPAEEAEPVGRTMEQKVKSDVEAAKAKMQQIAGPQAKQQEKPADKQEQESDSELSQQSTIPIFSGGGSDEEQTLQGSVKVAAQDDGFFNMTDGGTISYWPFLLVFVAAFASFVLMNFMKKRQVDDDFGSFQYKKKQAVQEYSKVQQEAKRSVSATPTTPVKAVKPVPKKKKQEEQPHFEIRI